MKMLRNIHFILLFFGIIGNTFAQEDKTETTTEVIVLEIKAEIDPRMSRYIELALEEAAKDQYDMAIIEMDTYGGLLTDADKIVTAILDFEKPIHVFINKDAASAGALISIGCDSIYMAPGSSIGAATVVMGEGEAAPDKYQSYMRGIMRSTAEAKGRNPEIAEAMVDQTLDLDSLAPAGRVLTFSTSEAIQNGYCEAQVGTIKEILDRQNIASFSITVFELPWQDKIIAFFLNPFISGILIMVIVGGIYFELQTPGIGFALTAAIIALVLYLVPYYLHGLAANWEILIFFLGIGLIGVEIFVIPGFGVAGVSGILLIVSALILIMLDNVIFDFSKLQPGNLSVAMFTAFAGMVGSVVLIVFGGIKFAESNMFKKVALTNTQDKNEGYTSSFYSESLLGKTGTAHTILRPSGKIAIDNEIYDAYTRGNYIEQGNKIEVISTEGTSLRVKKI